MDEVNVTENLAYDAAGRLRKRLIGTGPDSMVYDPAGNLVSARHRSGQWVTQSFDVLNRLVTRVVPQVVHGRSRCEHFEPGEITGPSTQCKVVFPYYPNYGDSLRIPADTARFVYDAVTGEMREANNRYARVHRSYYPAGAIKTDSTILGMYSLPSFDDVARGQQYSYDLSGRRTSMQWYLGTSSYQYNDFGALEQITDPNGNPYRITYDLRGGVDSLILGTGVREKRTYDYDGRLVTKNRVSTVLGTLVSDVLGYEFTNKVVSATESIAQQGNEQTLFSYDGLGAVLAKESGNGLGSARVEEFRNDAFGNVVHRLTRRTAGLVNDAPFAMSYSPMGEMTSAFAQVSSPAGQNERRDQLLQEFSGGSGQLLWQDQIIKNPNNSNVVEFQLAARHYYGADDRLMAVQRYSYRSLSVADGTWEDYWYDALGRRVLTHARREQGDNSPVPNGYKLCSGSGNVQCSSFKERVWWDGDNALVEERIPEGANSNASNSGIIGNIHGLTLDEPLAVIGSEPTRIINYNWRSQGMSSVFTDGSAGDISLGNTSTEVDWPASTQAETYFARSPDATQSNNAKRWLGTFVANGQGTTGMLYRRNRYFDPKSGQFTQADPIGIAGGMNAFGFADGDPINFSDPFGLLPCCTVTGLPHSEMYLGVQEAVKREQQDFIIDLAVGSIGATERSGSQLLKNLTRSGVAREAGEAAHHIVARAARQAQPAREALRHYGIDINEAVNGVFLPAVKGYAGRAANHLTLHTSRYYGAVNDIIASAQSRIEVIEALKAIKEQLLSGKFPP